jgi:CopG family nickel-responsive transcriptional regulator
MERLTISLESELAESFDRLVDQQGYASRSEAVRDLIRGWISQHALRRETAHHCIAQIGYVYNHHDRSLAERLAAIQHDEHHLTISTMHTHLNHEECFEVAFVRGATAEVRRLADRLIAEKGVRHGNVLLVPVEIDGGPRGHVPKGAAAAHVHVKPIS